MRLFKPRTTPEQRQAKVARALAKYGLKIDGVNIIEHETGKSLKAVRREINSASKSGRVSGFITVALNAIIPLPAGFTNPNNGTVHFQRRTGTVIRLHETVHGHDLIRTKIREMMQESIRKEDVSILTPLKYVKFKIEEFRVRSILEGRAKFCEKLAGKDREEFSFFERMKFKLSANLEAALFIITGSMATATLMKTFQNLNPIWMGLSLVTGGLAAWSATMLAPYVQGMWFMEKINQKVKDSKEVLRVTAEQPPTAREVFLSPNTYLRRVLHEEQL